MHLAPEPPFNAARPDTAPQGILARLQNLTAAATPQRRAALEQAAANYRELGIMHSLDSRRDDLRRRMMAVPTI
jgi:hypothetical protein